MMWEAAARKMREQGGKLRMGVDVVELDYDAAARRWTVVTLDAAGKRERLTAEHVISSTSIRELVAGLRPLPEETVRRAAAALRYRDFLIVALVVKDRHLFDDNWIYIHDPSVKVGRIQNFKSWSEEMVPDPALNCYGLEYFCNEGDELWTAPEERLVAMAKDELIKLGLAKAEDILDGHVIRQPKAYPVYDGDYAQHVATVRHALAAHYPNLHLVGRNGMHKYNNQDHAMMTALLTATEHPGGPRRLRRVAGQPGRRISRGRPCGRRGGAQDRGAAGPLAGRAKGARGLSAVHCALLSVDSTR